MQVVLERPSVWAGDVVRGTAYFHNSTRPVNYDVVYVEFSGKESNWFQEWVGGAGSNTGFDTDHMNRTRDDYRVYSYDNDIIKVRLPLVPQGSGTLGLGSYEFPFAIALPRDLPGTLKSEYMDARAYIEYKVSAVVDQAGFLAMDFKSSANLTVLQRAPRAPRPLREQKDIELTSGCCCFKSSEGAVQLRVEAPADVYYLGASRAVNFTAWVDNRANAALLTSCEASISRHLELFNPRGQLCHVESEPITKLKLQVPPGGVRPGASHVFSGLELPIDPKAQPTVISRLARLTYELRIDAACEGFLMSTSTIAPKIILCRDRPPAGKAGKGQPAAAAAAAAPAAARPAPPDGWSNPQKLGAALYSVDLAGSAKNVSVAEFESLVQQADAADAAPSAPPGAAPAGAPAGPLDGAGWLAGGGAGAGGGEEVASGYPKIR